MFKVKDILDFIVSLYPLDLASEFDKGKIGLQFGSKDNLQNTFFEKVRLNTADEFDCQMAVMFLTGKAPEEINDKIYENSLAYLRRNQSVFTSGIRLHGKK